jgi:transmembrane sensor
MINQQPDEERIAQLALKWQEGTLTPEEKVLFDRWFASFDDARMPDLNGESPEQLRERLYAAIQEKKGQEKMGRIRSIRRNWTVAAAVLLVLASSAGIFVHQSSRSRQAVAAGAHGVDTLIVPGGNRAILTLAGGGQVVLDSAKNGLLAQQGATAVVKQEDGLLSYEKQRSEPAGEPTGGGSETTTGTLYNTITTPRGGQYAVTLPDGTRVWLNAASSIRFPITFTGAERTVEVRGEAYFDVARNRSMPFRVAVFYPTGKMMEVEVLGTGFDIMAYADEAVIRTTLLEGAVRVVKGGGSGNSHGNDADSRTLRPGQLAQLKDNQWQIMDGVDTGDAIAWKNGRTLFANEDIPAIMRKVSRWYDVDVEYRGRLPERKFVGGISRSSDISALLKILELNHIHFSVEGKKIVLMP